MERTFTVLNSKVVIDLIVEKAEATDLINPFGKKLSTDVKEHPYRARVIFSPQFFYNGGNQYPCELQKGDIVSLAELPNPKDERNILVFNGKTYQVTSYTNIVGFERPTEETDTTTAP